jgi:hypothetical protein
MRRIFCSEKPAAQFSNHRDFYYLFGHIDALPERCSQSRVRFAAPKAARP